LLMGSMVDKQNRAKTEPGGRFFQNRHFWLVTVGVLILTAYSASEHLAPRLTILGFSSALVRDTFERSFFIIPVIYATVVFGLRGGFITLAASLLIVAPEFYMTQPHFAGFALQMVGAGSIAAGAIIFVNQHMTQRNRLKLAIERLDVAHDKLHQKVRSSIEQENRLAALTSFSAMLNESLDIQQVIDTAIDMVKEIMLVEVVLLFTLDEAAKELRITAFEGVNKKYAEAVDRMRLGDGFCGRVAKTGQPILIEDTLLDTEFTKPEAKEERLRTQLSVPLKTRGKIIGTLCAATRKPRQFTQTEIELLTAIGNLIGIAIENSYLYNRHEAATEKLRVSEKRYRRLFESALDAIWVQDLSGKIIRANQAAADMFGHALDELVGMDVRQLLEENDRALSSEMQERLLLGEKMPQPYTQKIIKKDGRPAVLMMTTNLTSTNGTPDGLQCIARDITEQVKMQENQQFYLEQITKAHEEERQRISRDLHDSSAQNLIGVLHQLENFCQTDEFLPMPRLRLLWSFHERLKDSLQEIRQLSRDLRPSILDDLGILPAIDWLVEQARTEHKLVASLKVSGERRRFSPEIEVTIFRIVQEALRNIVKHAGATKLWVKIEFQDSCTLITIEDNGKGFELPESLGGLSRMGKLGIDGMMTRARLVGGDLNVTSTSGQGTVIVADIPV